MILLCRESLTFEAYLPKSAWQINDRLEKNIKRLCWTEGYQSNTFWHFGRISQLCSILCSVSPAYCVCKYGQSDNREAQIIFQVLVSSDFTCYQRMLSKYNMWNMLEYDIRDLSFIVETWPCVAYVCLLTHIKSESRLAEVVACNRNRSHFTYSRCSILVCVCV